MHLAHEHGATISLIHAVDPAHLAETDRIDKNELQRSLDEVAQFARERKLEADIDHEVGRPWELIIAPLPDGRRNRWPQQRTRAGS